MKRLMAGAATIGILGVVLVVAFAASSRASDRFTVDAIFDNAAFLTPGSDVRIAGANVGKIESISLTAGRKARLRMSVDRRFAPFRSNADCTIQPQSLIGEKFVQCSPGTADQPVLQRDADTGIAEVPLANTHAPVDLDLVLGTFSQPTPARLALLLDALGNGLSGRGSDLNESLRRANPALQQTQRLLQQLGSERQTIAALTTESDRVVGSLAQRRESVARFIRDAGRLLTTTAGRTGELSQTLHEVPSVLDQAQPALRELDAVVTRARPVLSALDRSAGPLNVAVSRVRPFAAQVRPTLPALRRTAVAGRKTARQATPQLRRLARVAATIPPIAAKTNAFLSSSEDRGAIDGVLHFVYYATAALARYDSTSHILPAFPLVAGLCNVFATATVKQCDAHFAGGEVRAERAPKPKPKRDPVKSPAKQTAVGGPQVTGPTAAVPSSAATGALDALLQKIGDAVGPNGTVGGIVDKLTGKQPPGSGDDEANRGLLDYLLGKGS